MAVRHIVGQQELKLYTYVGNDPLDKTDPSGEICIFGWGNTCNGGTEGFFAWASQNLFRTGSARESYGDATQSQTDSAGRSAAKDAARAATPQPARAVVQALRPGTGPKPGSGGTANRTNVSWDKAGKVAGAVGKASLVVTVVAGVHEIATSSNPGRAAAGVGGSVVGGVGGGEGGALGGAAIGGVIAGPPGAAVGAVIFGIAGSVGGGVAGHEAGTAAYDEVTGP